MKFGKFMGLLVVLALTLAACAPAATEPPAVEPTTVMTEPSAGTEAPATEAPTSGVPVTGETTVMVSDVGTHGPVLVNSEGMSLYVFLADTQNSGTSSCGDDDGCTTDWPPLTTDGDPAAGEGVDAALLGTITRDDGSTQVTYNGWPLYLYAFDTAPGDANGQGLDEFGGIWYLVSPTGEAVLQ
jgi:predicted lipoprotein with Yx(FWY)xxD motif